LESLAVQDIVPELLEIIVVDNASTDATSRLVTEWVDRIPRLRYLREEAQGLSYARNRGWLEAKAPVVAFLDDDAVANPAWAREIVAVFAECGERLGCLGGPILPIFEAPPPDWLTPEIQLTVGIYDGGVVPVESLKHPVAYGANMAFRREVLEQVGGFTPGLGVSGTSLGVYEEDECIHRIMSAGLACRYDPRVVVEHHVHLGRMDREYFLRRKWCEGVTRARLLKFAEPAPSLLLKVRWTLGCLRRMASPPRQMAGLILRSTSASLFAARCRAVQEVACIAGLWSRA